MDPLYSGKSIGHMQRILIINGPNLNLLGKREPEIYGDQRFEDYFSFLQSAFPTLQLTYFQSNHEGALLDRLQEAGFSMDGIVLNAGAFTHTSIALADAIASIPAPVVEVHISNLYAREPFRQHSYSASRCIGVITGLGLDGYRLALSFFEKRQK